MTHSMQLTPSPFQMIKEGTKTIELRLFDEKRRKIQIGDIIEFSNTDTGEKIGAKVFDKNGQLVYLNQLELSDENTVNFSFSAKDGEEYTVMLGMKSRM